jgi:regulator of sirC expression with transglutaminase-like and TPR domain
VPLYEDAARREPRRAALHETLGKCYTRLGQVERARAAYERYLELAPGAADAEMVRETLKSLK